MLTILAVGLSLAPSVFAAASASSSQRASTLRASEAKGATWALVLTLTLAIEVALAGGSLDGAVSFGVPQPRSRARRANLIVASSGAAPSVASPRAREGRAG